MEPLPEFRNDQCWIRFTNQEIDAQATLAFVRDSYCGGEVSFLGSTRQWTQSEATKLETDYLVYEAYVEMAIKQLQQMDEVVRQKWPVRRTAIVHRLGRVEPKQASVAIAVSTPHRSEAFEACQWLIDTLKHDVPIWKQEHYVQHGSEWIHPTSGSCRCEPKVVAPSDVES